MATGRVTGVALDRAGRIFAATLSTRRTMIGSTAGGRALHAFGTRQPFTPPLHVAILKDDTIAVGDAQGRLEVREARSGALVRASPGTGALIGPPSVSAYSPDARLFAALWLGRPDVRTPVVFDLTRPRGQDRPLEGPAGAVDAMTFGFDGQMLATTAEGRVTLWSIRKRQALEVALSGLPGAASAVAFSPDDRFVAAAAERGVAVWEPRRVALMHSLKARGAVPGHVAPVFKGTASAAFSPNGRLLAWSLNATPSSGIVVWRLGAAKELLRFAGARVVGFSPDGTHVAGAVEYFESDFLIVNLRTGQLDAVSTSCRGVRGTRQCKRRPGINRGSSGAATALVCPERWTEPSLCGTPAAFSRSRRYGCRASSNDRSSPSLRVANDSRSQRPAGS